MMSKCLRGLLHFVLIPLTRTISPAASGTTEYVISGLIKPTGTDGSVADSAVYQTYTQPI